MSVRQQSPPEKHKHRDMQTPSTKPTTHLRDAALQVVAEGVWPLRHLLEHLSDHVLLLLLALHALVELDQAGLAEVVDDEDALNHRWRGAGG